MSLRQLCKDTRKRPLKALFFFPGENLTGIAQTWLTVEKDRELAEGMKVTVNWQGRKVHAEILVLSGQGRSQEETTTEANTRSIVRNQPYEIF